MAWLTVRVLDNQLDLAPPGCVYWDCTYIVQSAVCLCRCLYAIPICPLASGKCAKFTYSIESYRIHRKWCRICPIVKYYMFAHGEYVSTSTSLPLVSSVVSSLKHGNVEYQTKQPKLFLKIINLLFLTLVLCEHGMCWTLFALSPWQPG